MNQYLAALVAISLTFMIGTLAPAQQWRQRTVLKKGDGEVRYPGLSLSHNGKWLAASMRYTFPKSDKTSSEYQAWDAVTGKLLTWGPLPNDLGGLAITPDGKTLVRFQRDGTVLWSVADGRERVPEPIPYSGFMTAFALSADGKTFGVATYDGIQICDTATGAQRTWVKWRRRHNLVAFCPDLRVLAKEFYQDADLIDTVTGRLQRTLADHPGSVNGFAFSSDSKLLAVTVFREHAFPDYYNDIFVWDIATGLRRTVLKRVDICHTVGFVFDNRFLALLSRKTHGAETRDLRMVELASGRISVPVSFEEGVQPRGLAVSGDGRTTAIGCNDGSIRVYDLK